MKDQEIGVMERSFEKIEADSIVAEIMDKATGKIFRRTLPVKYLETDNGVILSGETVAGHPSEIAFYSEAALAKIHDLLGKGPDSPRCAGERLPRLVKEGIRMKKEKKE
ncbi:hypothetical protein [Acetonema longum]|uniref:Uncharacterized protein n=1 Tax=Acetonema longum DSM 6540 TaxID=1009370 RepID=F7NEC6_9FIRM|nr:hypothetical protein [Acetonema longum]EGO65638.1 hypothetical protein ALO_01944 [Acetonema longum DSM 6540]